MGFHDPSEMGFDDPSEPPSQQGVSVYDLTTAHTVQDVFVYAFWKVLQRV